VFENVSAEVNHSDFFLFSVLLK